ncbi:MAG: ABC transporter substrate-binding protein [Actinobacteria bacterium]|nr:ABC transporter substrate-binding protein [Actinomycetota bacterium]
MDDGSADDLGGDDGSGPSTGDTDTDGDGDTDSPPAVSGPKASCDGFKNGPGITDTTITVGNSSDISGPVPGLFEAAQDATKAFVAYFNATGDICGRKLVLKTYDSRTDAGADQQAYAAACDEVFAMIGSNSAFDSGGAAAAESCGLPDVRAATLTADRTNCSTCFGAQSVNSHEVTNAVPDYGLAHFKDASQHAAFLYLNAGASSENAQIQAKAYEMRGMHFDYIAGIDVAEFNYAPFVQQLKDRDIKWVSFTGSYQADVRLLQAMQQQDYRPDVYMTDPTIYVSDFVESGGSAAEGVTVYTNFVPFEEAASSKEMSLYLSWLQQVKPGAEPTFFGTFAWSAARLFTEQAFKLGGKLTRESLVAALRGVADWTANGLHAPQQVGSKSTGDCFRFLTLEDGDWKPSFGTKYSCPGITKA